MKNSRFFEYAKSVDNNSPKDPVDRKEADMSIGTQPGEKVMQRHQMIRASEKFDA